jgi:hypothetical protein
LSCRIRVESLNGSAGREAASRGRPANHVAAAYHGELVVLAHLCAAGSNNNQQRALSNQNGAALAAPFDSRS